MMGVRLNFSFLKTNGLKINPNFIIETIIYDNPDWKHTYNKEKICTYLFIYVRNVYCKFQIELLPI